jgi:glutaredoxin-like protein
MALIPEKDQRQLKKIFQSLVNNVRIVSFTQELECEHCKMNTDLLKEVTSLSEKISLEVHDFVKESDLAKKYGIDKIPATILLGDLDYGIRFYGVPVGYEFTNLIEDIIDISKRDTGLPEELLNELSKVDKPVHIKVLISPT